MSTIREVRCPRCNSPSPERHPAVQFGGEVQICPHSYHATAAGIMPAIREVIREAATAVTLGACFELIAIGSFCAVIVMVWAMVQRGLL